MKVLITGGVGFIGTNFAAFLAEKGYEVTILDNFYRLGTKENAKWLLSRYKQIKFSKRDIRFEKNLLQKIVEQNEIVFHLASQTAVTKSVENPQEDFEINAVGTFNVLEAVRLSRTKPILVFTSTNKVYGDLSRVKIEKKGKKYKFSQLKNGISEDFPLDFYSPYGCSKGMGDQYIHDYARIYGLKTIIFRQSCIYGPHQIGLEDQGWLAWFVIASQVLKRPITIYGDGHQVRDVLYIDDLNEAFYQAVLAIRETAGQIYNIGGGKKNVVSILESIALIEEITGNKIKVKYANWRPGDQKVYYSDIRKATLDFGWQPKIRVGGGLRRMINWILENKTFFEKLIH